MSNGRDIPDSTRCLFMPLSGRCHTQRTHRTPTNMTPIPRTLLLLGLAGLIPFVWGAMTLLLPSWMAWSTQHLGARLSGPYVGLAYGVVILAFMSGVLWGFAARATGPFVPWGYALSVLPALWAFFMTGMGPVGSAISLMLGFAALLVLDGLFARQGLTPNWWMRLRLLLTTIVLICLLVVVVT